MAAAAAATLKPVLPIHSPPSYFPSTFASMTATTATHDTQNRSTIYPPSPPISDLETDDASASASAIQENKIEIIIPEQKATDDMVDKSHPSAQAPKKTQLLLGNLPPKQAGFGNVLYPRTPSRVDPNNPPWPAYRGYHEYSFAHATMGVRLPTILGKAIDDTVKTLNDQSDEEKILDLVACIDRMEDLMEDLQNNQKLRPIKDDGEGDIPLWNKEIARFFRGKDFMNAPWLFAEAYKYRRLHECFSISRFWGDYDVFFRQKCETFSRSGQAVFELSTRFADPFKYEEGASEDARLKARELVFAELTQVCLWGNSTDLSLLINMTEEDIRNLQSTGGDHLASTEKNILGNHLPKLWQLVSKLKGGRIDFVLDNAGFELYCDCVYADWLIQSGLASQIRFHGKRFAWFVSDVTRKDWNWLLNSCVYGHLFTGYSNEELASLKKMGQRWKVCPPNSTRQADGTCQCKGGFNLLNQVCVQVCGLNQVRNPTTGSCVCQVGFQAINGLVGCFSLCGLNSHKLADGTCVCNPGFTKNVLGLCLP